MDIASTDLRFPIGRYRFKGIESEAEIKAWIEQITQHPKALKSILHKVNEEALDWRYRPEGWTIRQVIHHMADSHMNSIIRFKLALTEDAPTIKPYKEALWAELDDTLKQDIGDSVRILEGVHSRLSRLLNCLDATKMKRIVIHPEHGKEMSIKELIGLYAWHGRHHNTHIEQALASKGGYNE